MSFAKNAFLATTVALGTMAVCLSAAEAGGCGRGGYGGGGYRGGYGGYSAHRYAQPYYNSHTYARPQQVVRPIQTVQPIAQPGLQQAPVQQFAQPQQFGQLRPAVQPQQVAQPQTIAPQQTIQQQPVVPQQTTPPAPVDASQSALQALGGTAVPQTPAPQQVQTPAHVGNWTASLANGATVRLTLQADGSFSWVATNKAGTASSFSGTYTVGNGALTLNRSTDNQKLAGAMTLTNGNAFTFQVGGQNAGSLNFVRA